MGTAEIESALVAHEKVAEAAVVGYAIVPSIALGDPSVVDDIVKNRVL